ncbi:carbon-nitrogen hydrolase family protein [Thiofilum flexile]|uniref:carbon-nitrogen hydrolase family protein n=1 Tax=Thiofilum flexile TaxID=125627 RepID=UPI00036E5DB6|nr:carbon-nitrogen hydrolase family protein [Thiofilum flexile]
MRPFTIAGVQMQLSATSSNLDQMYAKLSHLMLRFPWTQMVVFSELAAFGPYPSFAQPLPGPAEQIFQRWAEQFKIWLIPGSLFEAVDDKIYNTTPIINPQGEVVDRYRKQFPFLPFERGISAGDRFVTFDIPDVGRFGVSICYDMWFPETTRSLAALGAEIIIHPTFTDTIDRQAELTIARASAITNQCFFFDVNGLGGCGNGLSCVIDPSGRVLHQAGTIEEVFPLEINLEQVRHERQNGIMGLGQVLKSFRDRAVDFTVYDKSTEQSYLDSLGPMQLRRRS